MSYNNQAVRETRSEMQNLMDEAVGLVRGGAGSLEKDFVTPAVQTYTSMAQTHPILAVFFVTVALMSFMPIMTFTLFATVIFVSFIVTAVTAAIIGATTICAIAGSVLLFTLALVFGAAVFSTFSYIGLRLAYRLAFHLFGNEGQGLNVWIQESLGFLGIAKYVSEARRTIASGKTGLFEPIPGDSDVQVSGKRFPKVEENSADEWSAVDHGVNGVGGSTIISTGPLDNPQPEEPTLA